MSSVDGKNCNNRICVCSQIILGGEKVFVRSFGLFGGESKARCGLSARDALDVQKAGRAFAIAENPRTATETHDGTRARSSPPTTASIASRPDRRFPRHTRAKCVRSRSRAAERDFPCCVARTLLTPFPQPLSRPQVVLAASVVTKGGKGTSDAGVFAFVASRDARRGVSGRVSPIIPKLQPNARADALALAFRSRQPSCRGNSCR